MDNTQKKFYKILEYIESNLDKAIDIEKLSFVAHLSKYHFHRQCSAFLGISIYKFIKILRLKRAAYQIAYRNNLKIVDIALINGYKSHEAFSRAFHKIFSKSPSEFRKNPDWTPWYKQYDPIVKLRSKNMPLIDSYKVELVDFPEIPIAVIEHKGTPKALGNTIRQFIQWRKENALPPSKSRTFNLIYHDPYLVEPETFRLDIACSINKIIDNNNYGIMHKIIPKGRCAVIRYIGADNSINAPIYYLYSIWLANTKVKLRDFPLFFERVNFFPDVAEHEAITDIYLPIE